MSFARIILRSIFLSIVLGLSACGSSDSPPAPTAQATPPPNPSPPPPSPAPAPPPPTSCPASGSGRTLYVDAASGSDATVYADNSATRPWRSIERAVWGSNSIANPNAAQAARAGDTVVVRAGTYTVTQNHGLRYVPALNPANNGTATDPITIVAEGNVVLRSAASGASGPLIGTHRRSHVVWDGFFVDEPNIDTVADTGPVVVWSSDNITIQNLTIQGKTAAWNDNHNGIRIEDSSRILIRNNRISGIHNGGSNANGAAIMVYTSSHVTFEHNDISSSGAGMFVKGANPGPFTLRYNLLRDMNATGIIIGGVGTAATQDGARIYQNVLRDLSSGVSFIGYDAYSPANIDVVNNTIQACTNGGIFLKPNTAGYSDIVITNNIIVDCTPGVQAEDIADVGQVSFSHNMYHGISPFARVSYTNYTFDTWRATFQRDTVGSSVADPLFVNKAGDDFRLTSGSPARDAGRDVLNLTGNGSNSTIALGAYVSGSETIGITTRACGTN